MNKYIGKVILINLPGVKRPRYRWIVRIREDGRVIVRTPKINVRLYDLKFCRDKDFNKETLLPNNSSVWKSISEKNKKRNSRTSRISKSKSKSRSRSRK